MRRLTPEGEEVWEATLGHGGVLSLMPLPTADAGWDCAPLSRHYAIAVLKNSWSHLWLLSVMP